MLQLMIFLLFLASPVFAQSPFLDLQEYYGDWAQGYVPTNGGCTHSTSGNTTAAITSCRAFTLNTDVTPYRLERVEETNSRNITYSGGDGGYWLIAHSSKSDTVAGWTRVAGTHYLWQLNASRPTLPSRAVFLMRTNVSGGAITIAQDIRPTIILNSSVLDQLTGCVIVESSSGGYVNEKIATAIASLPSTGGCVDARGILGTQTWSSTLTITSEVQVLLGAATYQYAGAGCAIDIQNNGVQIIGLGPDMTTFSITGVAGTERGICSAGGAGGTRYFRVLLQGFTVDGTDTAGTIGLDLTDIADTITTYNVRVLDFGTGMEIIGSSANHRGRHYAFDISSNSTGILITGANNSHSFYGGRMNGNTTYAIYLSTTNQDFFSGLILDGNTPTCIYLDAHGHTFVGNRFEDCGTTLLVDGTANAEGNTFIGNFHSSGGDEIRIAGSGNIFDSIPNTTTGIYHPSGRGGQDIMGGAGDFEYAQASGGNSIPLGWSFSATVDNTESITLNTGAAQSGTYGLVFANTNSDTPRITYTFNGLSTAGEYVLSFWGLCTTGTNTCQVLVGTGTNGSGSCSRNINGDSLWHHYTCRFVPATTTPTITARINSSGAATMWLDSMGLYGGVIAPSYSDTKCVTGPVTINPDNANANTTTDTDTTITGLVTGSQVSLSPPTTLDTGLGMCGAMVSSSNTLRLRLCNLTGGAINAASATYAMTVCKNN